MYCKPILDTEQSIVFDYSKSLEEIEADIILHVMIEENMNQTKAAQRLRISRSTLWRKLKSRGI